MGSACDPHPSTLSFFGEAQNVAAAATTSTRRITRTTGRPVSCPCFMQHPHLGYMLQQQRASMHGISSSQGIATLLTRQQHCFWSLRHVVGSMHLHPQHPQQRHGAPTLQQVSTSKQHKEPLPLQPMQSGHDVYSAWVMQQHELMIVRSFSSTASCATYGLTATTSCVTYAMTSGVRPRRRRTRARRGSR